MFRKVLLATDFSPASDCLLRCAGELKMAGLGEVVLVHVIYVANTPGLEDRMRAENSPELQRQKRLLEEQGVQVTVEMPVGLPARTLAEMAERHAVSLILAGARGKGILRSSTLGSVSAGLIHLAARPLLIARTVLLEGERCELACGRLFESLLFATDFSEAAERALDYVAAIAAGTGCPVTLLHVLDSTAKPRPDEENARFLLDAKRGRLERKGAKRVTAELGAGDPADEVVRRGSGAGASLVVLGSRGKGIVKELLVGSVANAVARRAGMPVLLVPATRQTEALLEEEGG
jgi:nucleotide-binding universal stress UspA family protein